MENIETKWSHFLVTDITFDGELRFQPSKGHFYLKFNAPSYPIIKFRKKDGFQKIFFEFSIRRDMTENTKFFFQRWSPNFFFSKMESKFYRQWYSTK